MLDRNDGSSINVFDLDGRPVVKYRTDWLMAFAIDEEHARFIGQNEVEANGVLSVFLYELTYKIRIKARLVVP